MSRGVTTIYRPEDISGPGSAGSSKDYGSSLFPLTMDLKRSLRQVPTKLNPLYGIHVGRSMFLLLAAFFILGLMGFITQLELLFWATSLSVAVFFVSVLLPGWMINAIEVTKTIPESGIVSRPLTITYTIRNKHRLFSLRSIRIVELFSSEHVEDLPHVYIPVVGPGETLTFRVSVTPANRGHIVCLGTRLASRYPFGLLTRFRTVEEAKHIVVYPAMGVLTSNFMPAHKASEYQMGITLPRHKGSSDEFYALREYRVGDNPRFIHWRRTARMGRLVVREMSQYAPHRLTLILDTFMPEEKKNRVLFEQTVSFAATLLCHSLERGYRTALVCTNVPPMMVPPLSGRPAQLRILKTLSEVEYQTTYSLPDLFNTWRFTGSWSGRCLVVGLSDPHTGVLKKLNEVIGPVQYFHVGTPEWRQLFIPPMYLREARGDAHD